MEFPHKKPISYSCVKCGYTTNRKSNYMYHINRKIPCVAGVNNLSDLNLNGGNDIGDALNNNVHVSNNNVNVPDVNVSMALNNNVDVSNIEVGLPNNNVDVSNIEVDASNNNVSMLNDGDTKYRCNKCSKVLSTKRTLNTHVRNCMGVHSLQCPKCLKEFSSQQGKYQHMKYVTCIPINPHHPMTVINNNTTNNNTTNNNTTNNNTTNNNITNNIDQKQIINNVHNHIQINAFGKENCDYLIDEHNRLRNILQKKNKFMQEIIEAIHFDDEHPENRNIMMTNLQSKHIMIHDGTKFVKALKEPTFNQLIQKKRNFINGNIEDLGLTIGSERYIKEKLASLRSDDEKQKMLKEKIELMCYNKRNMCEDMIDT